MVSSKANSNSSADSDSDSNTRRRTSRSRSRSRSLSRSNESNTNMNNDVDASCSTPSRSFSVDSDRTDRTRQRNSPTNTITYAEAVSGSSRPTAMRAQRKRKRHRINAFRHTHSDRSRQRYSELDRSNHNSNNPQPAHIEMSMSTRIEMNVADADQQIENQSTVEASSSAAAEDDEESEHIELEELRDFHFSIDNDANLQEMDETQQASSASRSPVRPGHDNSQGADAMDEVGGRELTAEYILSKLYNYMKISEMSKYGIRVFEMTFSSYLPFLSEADLTRLATSYWCNGQHFNCMAAHRGDRIKSSTPAQSPAWRRGADYDEPEVLALRITSELLDAAMQSGASVDKIDAMLVQKRRDEGVPLVPQRSSPSMLSWKSKDKGRRRFYQTKYERDFYLRNLKHRFWNHEVLVRVFVQNGWMTSSLADYAIKTFVKSIYRRVLQSKAKTSPSNAACTHFSEGFLRSFFVGHFGLDDIPKMYAAQIGAMNAKMARGGSEAASMRHGKISDETLRRWCELVELLASRGAAEGRTYRSEFALMVPLQYALSIGQNTFKIISSSHREKNRLLIPEHFAQHNICVPDDIWDVLVGYL